jgi:deoxyribodipyrimidine photo-lyase
MKTTPVTVFWFRRDLRFNDNAGLYHALKSRKPVVGFFIFDEAILDKLNRNLPDNRVDFIYNAIQQLRHEFEKRGGTLEVIHATVDQAWKQLMQAYSIQAVYTNHDYEPYARTRDKEIGTLLTEKGITFYSCKDQVIFEKNEIVKDDGKPYTVFTPYKNKWRKTVNEFYLRSYPVEKYAGNLHQTTGKFRVHPEDIGFPKNQDSATDYKLTDELLKQYAELRDFPARNATSRLSIHLRFGTVSIRELFRHAAPLSETWTNELIWREFYMQILWHFPHIATQAFKPEYDRIVWRNNEEEFKKWCDGKTGYPLVDAGMRELNATGFMHNRVRMVVASFLTKHLLIDWRWGEAYFAAKLNDFELSSNNGGWQWAAGSGTDAAPYFRIFNPSEQFRKFDPQAVYVKKWVPEYGTSNYPQPIVDHAFARDRCLTTYKTALAK